jgi:hypothetical protein
MKDSKTIQQTSISIVVAMLVFIFPPNAFAKSEIKEELHKTYNLHSEGRVTLENVNGNVHIAVAAKLFQRDFVFKRYVVAEEHHVKAKPQRFHRFGGRIFARGRDQPSD